MVSYPNSRLIRPTGVTIRKNITDKKILDANVPIKCDSPNQKMATYLKSKGIAIAIIRQRIPNLTNI